MGFCDDFSVKLKLKADDRQVIFLLPKNLIAKAAYAYNLTDNEWIKLRRTTTPNLASTIEGRSYHMYELTNEGKKFKRDGFNVLYFDERINRWI